MTETVDKILEKDELEYLELLESLESELKYNQIKFLFPEKGPYRKELYKKHINFMKAGGTHSQRLFSGGNRTGKTKTGGAEMAYHLTGDYPNWWEGRQFLNPISAWAAGVTNQSTKEIQQFELLGSMEEIGTGLIPADKIIKVTRKPGVAGAIETVFVRHRSGGISELTFKSYEQGRENFQGTKKQVIWLDEEPRDYGIYEECLMRTMDDVNPGIIYCTFTPLFGLSTMVLSFTTKGKFPKDHIHPKDSSKYATQVTWDEVPHLSEKQKSELIKSIAPHLRDARTKGIPHLGVGAVYPFPEEEVTCKPFPIPDFWPKAYGLDVGWNRTAAIWGAMDPDSKIIYIYSEHYQAQSIPAIQASAIRARGANLWGAIDPGSRTANQLDGRCLFNEYEEEGLNLELADNAVESGILKISQLLMSGQLKIFNTLDNFLEEYRTYRRDEKGKIESKQEDHAMDAWRYLMMASPDIMSLGFYNDDSNETDYDDNRDSYTGY